MTDERVAALEWDNEQHYGLDYFGGRELATEAKRSRRTLKKARSLLAALLATKAVTYYGPGGRHVLFECCGGAGKHTEECPRTKAKKWLEGHKEPAP